MKSAARTLLPGPARRWRSVPYPLHRRNSRSRVRVQVDSSVRGFAGEQRVIAFGARSDRSGVSR